VPTPIPSPIFGPYSNQAINDNGWWIQTILSSLSVSNAQSWAIYEIVNDPTTGYLTINSSTWEMTWYWDLTIWSWSQDYNITIKVTNPNWTSWQQTFKLTVNDNA
jgi:hypothetical protein